MLDGKNNGEKSPFSQQLPRARYCARNSSLHLTNIFWVPGTIQTAVDKVWILSPHWAYIVGGRQKINDISQQNT